MSVKMDAEAARQKARVMKVEALETSKLYNSKAD